MLPRIDGDPVALNKLPLAPNPTRMNDKGGKAGVPVAKGEIARFKIVIGFFEPLVHVELVVAGVPDDERQVVLPIQRVVDKVVRLRISDHLAVDDAKSRFSADLVFETARRRRQIREYCPFLACF